MELKRFLTITLTIVVVFILGVILKIAKPVLFPFFLAIFLSFILYPILDLLMRYKIPKAVAVLFIVLATFFIIYLMGALFYSSGKSFADEFPTYGQKIESILTSLFERLNILFSLNLESFKWFDQLDVNKVGNLLLDTLGGFLSFLTNLFLILLFMVFILAGRGQTQTKILRSFNKKDGQKLTEIRNNIDAQIQRYLGIKTIISFITGLLATGVLLIFGVDFAVVWGFFTFILNYIPNIGSIIATALPVIIAVFQFDSLWTAIWILIILGSVQMTLGNFIEPRIMGHGLGLSPLVVVFSLVFWGWLWGLPGMILAVPIAAIIKIVISNIPSLEFVSVLMSKS
jgi:predicted PurR-regulated permease PerM